MSGLAVGSTVWIKDENRRVYDKSKGSSPIFREYFVPIKINSETSRSWVISYQGRDRKIDKKTLEGIYPSQESVDNEVWIHDNVYWLTDHIKNCRDVAKLKRIANIMDWQSR